VRSESITDKVFDTDSNPISARLLVWGPEDVDGETCIIVEPTDFLSESSAPNYHYDGQRRPVIAADDLRIAVPVRFFLPPTIPLCPNCLSSDVEFEPGVVAPSWKCGNCGYRAEAPIHSVEGEPGTEIDR
jgi:hypothetical protein